MGFVFQSFIVGALSLSVYLFRQLAAYLRYEHEKEERLAYVQKEAKKYKPREGFAVTGDGLDGFVFFPGRYDKVMYVADKATGTGEEYKGEVYRG